MEVRTVDGVVRAHCANPGRLWEILLPGRRVILERRPEGSGSTTHTLAAAYHRNRVVPLLPQRANAVARELLLRGIIPGIRSIRAEVPLHDGRTDFLVDHAAGRTLVEVKSCSLVEFGVAMFPDAKSDRATRHLEALANAGEDALVLFVVTHGRPNLFCPNLHSDPAFALALRRHAGRVAYRAAVIEADATGRARFVCETPVVTTKASLVEKDCGTLGVEKRDPECSAPKRVSAAFYCPGLAKAVRRAASPSARPRYPIYGPEDWSAELDGASASDPAFIEAVLRLRHRSPLGTT